MIQFEGAPAHVVHDPGKVPMTMLARLLSRNSCFSMGWPPDWHRFDARLVFGELTRISWQDCMASSRVGREPAPGHALPLWSIRSTAGMPKATVLPVPVWEQVDDIPPGQN